MAIKKRDRAPRCVVDLGGPDGNAWVLLGIGRNMAKQLKLDWPSISAKMMSSDYQNLVRVFDKYFGRYIDIVLPEGVDSLSDL
jgi:hypothetical protein